MRREMPWLWEAWSSDEPTTWARMDNLDWRVWHGKAVAHEKRVQLYREVIKDDYPEIYQEICAAEPDSIWDSWVASSPETIQLPADCTNWHQLYCDITRNWKDLNGLQNRRRIWIDVERIIQCIKWFRKNRKWASFYDAKNLPDSSTDGLDDAMDNSD